MTKLHPNLPTLWRKKEWIFTMRRMFNSSLQRAKNQHQRWLSTLLPSLLTMLSWFTSAKMALRFRNVHRFSAHSPAHIRVFALLEHMEKQLLPACVHTLCTKVIWTVTPSLVAFPRTMALIISSLTTATLLWLRLTSSIVLSIGCALGWALSPQQTLTT